jgi:hypothetical protein
VKGCVVALALVLLLPGAKLLMRAAGFNTGPDDDIRWLGSISDTQLHARLSTGFDVRLLGFPAGSSVGFDLRVYESGLKLIRGVPAAPAVHVVTLLSDGSNGPPSSLCVGAFIVAESGQAVLVEYIDGTASLRIRVVPSCHGDEQRVGDRGVAIYSKPHEEAWTELSDMVTPVVMGLAGVRENSAVCSVDDKDGNEAMEAAQAQEAPGEPVPLKFDPLPNIRRMDGMSAAEVTEFNMDRSAYVTYVVATRYHGHIDSLLGDAQFSFLSFFLLRSLTGLHHWSYLVAQICGSAELATDAPELVARFARVLRAQILLLDPEVLPLLDCDRFQESMDCLFLHADATIPELRKLRQAAHKHFGWIGGIGVGWRV